MQLTRRAFLGTAAAGAAFGLTGQVSAQTKFKPMPGRPYEGTTINIMLPNAGQYQAQAARLGQLEEMTGIKAVHGYVPYGQLLDRITTEAVSQSSTYDLVTYQDSWGPSISAYIDPIDERVADGGFDMTDYPKVFVSASTYKGKLYGLPVRAQAQLLFYRKDLFEKAKVEPPKTMDELVVAAKAVQENSGISGIAMDYGKGNGYQNLFTWLNFLRGYGTDMLTDGGEVAFNGEAGIAATQAYLDIHLKHGVAAPGSVQFVEGDKVNSMAQGNSAMVMVWWWGYPVLIGERSTLSKEQVGFVNVPNFGNGNVSNIGQGMPFAINTLSKNKDAAWEVMKWMASPELEVDIALDPKFEEIIVVHTSSLLNEQVNERYDGLQRAGYESLEVSRAMPLLRAWPQVASVLENTISALAATGNPVQPAMEEAAVQVERILRRMPD